MADSTSPKSGSGPATDVAAVRWRLDPKRSSVEFQSRAMWGVVKVKGHFEQFEGTLDMNARPAVELTMDAASLDTAHKRRDEHLRGPDFFNAERYPEVRFVSDDAVMVEAGTLHVDGQVSAAGAATPLELDATVHASDGELEIEAAAELDRRELGMTWNRLGNLATLNKLIVRGRLVPDPEPDR